MRFSLSFDSYKTKALKARPEIERWIKKKGHEVVKRDEKPDIEITFGGDGNTIRTVPPCSELGIPVLSINAGNVGFLTFGDFANWKILLNKLINGEYTVEERIGLKLMYNGNFYGPLANDVYFDVTRGVALYSVWDNDLLLYNKLMANGMIVSTPTGSTGYNMGAGGPICVPGVSVMLVTPICSTVLNSVPLLVSANSIIRVDVEKCRKPYSVLVMADGREIDEVRDGATIVVRKHSKSLKYVVMDDSNFYSALQTKKGLRV